MKCPNCKGNVAGSYKGKTCPSCGEPLPERRHVILEWAERVAGFTEDRGFIFWLIAFTALVVFIAALEHLFGAGKLALLLDQHKFIGILTILFIAGHLKLIRNINSTIRPGYPEPYWIDRLIIRKFRQGTNSYFILGLIASAVVVGPFNVLALMPAYALITSLFLAAFWSVQSFRVDDREFTDAKVRSYFEYLGVRNLSDWRKASGAYGIAVVVGAAVFYGLSQVDGLWYMIRDNPTLNEIIDIISGLFSWVPQIVPKK